MVSVCRGYELDLTAGLADLLAEKGRVIGRGFIQSKLFTENAKHAVASTQALKGFQAKTRRFVLNIDRLYSVLPGSILQSDKRRHPVRRNAFMEAERLFCFFS